MEENDEKRSEAYDNRSVEFPNNTLFLGDFSVHMNNSNVWYSSNRPICIIITHSLSKSCVVNCNAGCCIFLLSILDILFHILTLLVRDDTDIVRPDTKN